MHVTIVAAVVLFSFFANPLEAKVETSNVWSKNSFTNALGSRSYWVYKPKSVRPVSRLTPLVVMLHACLQNGEQFAGSTRMNELAERERFTVIYPEQAESANPLSCWNWFKKENQARQKGEAGLIADLVSNFLSEHPYISRDHVYLAGFSAGGGMASLLSVCYPDVFAAAALHSGIGFSFAEDPVEGVDAIKKGSKKDLKLLAKEARDCFPERTRFTPTMIIQGDKDEVVGFVNASQMTSQLLMAANLHKTSALLETKAQVKESAAFYPYSYEVYGKNKKSVLIKKVLVAGLDHAWSGGDETYKFSDKKGPDMTNIIWDFFSSQARIK